jgi:hypothetical protein
LPICFSLSQVSHQGDPGCDSRDCGGELLEDQQQEHYGSTGSNEDRSPALIPHPLHAFELESCPFPNQQYVFLYHFQPGEHL